MTSGISSVFVTTPIGDNTCCRIFEKCLRTRDSLGDFMTGKDSLGDKIHEVHEKLTKDCREGYRIAKQILLGAVLWLYYQVLVVSYFFIVSRKIKIRNFARYSVLMALTLSSSLLLIEVSLEFTGREHILRWMHRLSLGIVTSLDRWRAAQPTLFVYLPPSELLVTIVLLAFLGIAGFYLFFHNIEEARKPEHEYRFARAIHSLLLDSHTAHAGGPATSIQNALEMCHFLFRHRHVRQVSLHVPDNNVLKIRAEHVWPKGTGFQETALQPGEGLAGQVFEDEKLHIQYAPRLRYPINRRYFGWLFPHTMKYRFLREKVANTGFKLWNLSEEGNNFAAFKQVAADQLRYRSLLSVPVVSVSEHEILGVLNLDFSTTNPLDKADIAMAAGFALVLGGEIQSGGIAL